MLKIKATVASRKFSRWAAVLFIPLVLLCFSLPAQAKTDPTNGTTPGAASTDSSDSSDSTTTEGNGTSPDGRTCGTTNPLCCGTAAASQEQCVGSKNPDFSQTCDNCFIERDVQPIFNLLSILVVLAILGNLIFGGIQYMMASDKPDRPHAARQRITGAVTALFIYLLLYAFIQYLIPGGIF